MSKEHISPKVWRGKCCCLALGRFPSFSCNVLQQHCYESDQSAPPPSRWVASITSFSLSASFPDSHSQPFSLLLLWTQMAAEHYTFGPYKIHQSEVFYSTPLSYAMVNLRPLLPGNDQTRFIHLYWLILLIYIKNSEAS